MAISRDPIPRFTPPDAEKFKPAKTGGLLERVKPQFELTIQKIFPLGGTGTHGESTLAHDQASQVNPKRVVENQEHLKAVNRIRKEQGLLPLTSL